MEIEDPYSYRDRLTLPKLVMQAAGDQYFLPDSSRFYFDDLKGEKYLRYIPNTDHGLRNTRGESSLAFYQAVVSDTPQPSFPGRSSATRYSACQQRQATAVKLWQATNPEHRDFRLATLGPQYKSGDLEDRGAACMWVTSVNPRRAGRRTSSR